MELSYPRRAQAEECFRIECNREEYKAILDALHFVLEQRGQDEKRISVSDINNMDKMLNKNPADYVPIESAVEKDRAFVARYKQQKGEPVTPPSGDSA